MAINSLNAASHGLSGLVSGINSQEMVEKLLAGTQAKMDKAGQKKTTLQYKQTMYRDVAAKLRALQSSFLSFTNPKTNLLSNAFYNAMNASITPPKGKNAAFSVSATSNAKAGNTTVDYIQQLARAYSWKTTGDASGAVSGTMSQADAQKLLDKYTGADARLEIKVGNESIVVNNATKEFGGKSSSEVAAKLTALFEEKGIGARARFENNKLVIQADDPNASIELFSNRAPTVVDKTLGMQMFGDFATLSAKGSFTSAIDTDRYLPSFKVNLDGREQTVRVDLAALEKYATTGNATDLVNSINDKLTRAFGTGVQMQSSVVDGKTVISVVPGSPSQQFTITGGPEIMKTLGLKAGISNKLNKNMALKDLNFKNELLGSTQTFSINGVEFSFTADTTLSNIMNTINNSKAGVKMSYIESEDRFVLENAESGAGNDRIELKQTEGNLFSVLFGVQSGGSLTGPALVKNISGAAWSDEADMLAQIKDGGSFTFSVNGRDVTFKVPKKSSGEYTLEEFTTKMNEAFKSQFGTLADGTQGVEFKMEGNAFQIVSNNRDVKIAIKEQDDKLNTSLLGFTAGDSNRVTDASSTLAAAGIVFGSGGIDVKVGGTTVRINGSDLDGKSLDQVASTIQTALQQQVRAAKAAQGLTGSDLDDAVAKVKVDFDSQTSGFKIVGVDVPMEISIGSESDSRNLERLFGSNSITLSQAGTSGMYQEEAGRNAILSINGTEIQRNNNSFIYDGLSFTLTDTTQMFNDDGTPVMQGSNYVYDKGGSITVTRDTDQIVEGLQEFLKQYNETIDYINGLFKADPTYKSYQPLTEKQKQEMSDREIELWEKKSQEGLLRGDAALDKILSSMRAALNASPDGSDISIYSLGISTSFYYNDGNFKAEDASKLKAAIENDPDAVRRLMAGEGGLMELLNKAIDEATRISYASPGTLVALAGSNVSEADSSIYKQVKEIDKQVTSLEKKYWSEYNRYWKQFNAMEQMIQQMNVQSSWLSQQLSGLGA